MGNVDLSRKSFLCLAGASLDGYAATPRETAAATAPTDKARYYVTLPSLGTLDVVVFGAGLAGVGAAIRAARAGRRVALVEKYGVPGGAAVYGQVQQNLARHSFARNRRACRVRNLAPDRSGPQHALRHWIVARGEMTAKTYSCPKCGREER